MRIIIIFLLQLWSLAAQYQPLECFRTQRVTLWSGNQLPKAYQVGGYNTVLAWVKPTPNIAYSFLSYVGFKLPASTGRFLSFTSSLSVSPTQGIININPHNSYIVYMDFVVTLITSACFSDIQVVKTQYNCLLLSQTTRNINLFGSIIEEYTILYSTKFVFTPPAAYIVKPFISALQVASIDPTRSQFIFVFFNRSEPNKNNFTLTVRSWDAYRNIIESVTISTLIISKKTMIPSLVFYTVDTSNVTGTTNFQSNFGIPDHFYSMGYEDKCLMALNRMLHHMSQPVTEFGLTKLGRNITGMVLQGMDSILFYTVCLIQCKPGYFNPLNGSTVLCFAYPSFVANCISYDSQNRCTHCATDFTLTSPYSCSLCNGVGQLTAGGCSTTVGCVQVVKVGGGTVCVACAEPDFFLDDFGVCQCYIGWIVTANCIKNYGCVTTKKAMEATVCSACNSAGKFALNGSYCVCVDGYELSAAGTCLTVCGDGKVVDKEECDDGNAESGDGCGGCAVEANYKCSGGTVFSPSHCRYVGRPLSIAFLFADKTPDANQGVFTFSVSPAISLLSRMNLSHFFAFASPVPHAPPLWTYSFPLLQLRVDYFADLEGTEASFLFAFDTNYVLHASIGKAVTVRSRGTKLVLVRGLSSLKTMGETVGYLSAAALLTVGAATLARRMMGAETLQLFQVLYFVHLAAADYTELYAKLRHLGSLSGDFLFLSNALSGFKVGERMGKLVHSAANTEHTVVTLFGLFVCLCGLILLTAILKQMRPRFMFLLKVRTVLQDNALFTLLIGAWLPMSFITLTLSNCDLENRWVSKNGVIFMAYLLCLAIYLCIFFEWRSFILVNIIKQAPKYYIATYVPIFISFFFLQITLTTIAAMDYDIYLRECIGFIAVLMLVWQLKVSPYKRKIHNFGIFYNQLLIVLFCMWSILRDWFPILTEEDNQSLFMTLVIVLLFMQLILTAVRTILAIKETCQQYSVVQTKKIKKMAKILKLNPYREDLDSYLKESMIANNPYTLERIKKTEIIKDWKEENERRDELQTAEIFYPKDMENRFRHIKKSLVRPREKNEMSRSTAESSQFH